MSLSRLRLVGIKALERRLLTVACPREAVIWRLDLMRLGVDGDSRMHLLWVVIQQAGRPRTRAEAGERRRILLLNGFLNLAVLFVHVDLLHNFVVVRYLLLHHL